MMEFAHNVPYGILVLYCMYICRTASDEVEKNMLKSTLLWLGALGVAALSMALMLSR